MDGRGRDAGPGARLARARSPDLRAARHLDARRRRHHVCCASGRPPPHRRLPRGHVGWRHSTASETAVEATRLGAFDPKSRKPPSLASCCCTCMEAARSTPAAGTASPAACCRQLGAAAPPRQEPPQPAAAHELQQIALELVRGILLVGEAEVRARGLRRRLAPARAPTRRRAVQPGADRERAAPCRGWRGPGSSGAPGARRSQVIDLLEAANGTALYPRARGPAAGRTAPAGRRVRVRTVHASRRPRAPRLSRAAAHLLAARDRAARGRGAAARPARASERPHRACTATARVRRGRAGPAAPLRLTTAWWTPSAAAPAFRRRRPEPPAQLSLAEGHVRDALVHRLLLPSGEDKIGGRRGSPCEPRPTSRSSAGPARLPLRGASSSARLSAAAAACACSSKVGQRQAGRPGAHAPVPQAALARRRLPQHQRRVSSRRRRGHGCEP